MWVESEAGAGEARISGVRWGRVGYYDQLLSRAGVGRRRPEVGAIRLRILGPLSLVVDGGPVKAGGPRDQVVLAMLAMRANRVVSFEQLIDAVWEDAPPSSARGQVQTSISALRKLLAEAGLPDAIKTRSSGYVLEVARGDLDSAGFAAMVAAAHRQAADGQAEAASETLRDALGLWRGPALDGLGSDLVRNGAAVLDEARLTAAEERFRLELELGRHAAVVGELRALLVEHRWRERLYGYLMLALYRTGRQADALEVFRRARAVLVAEVGIEPGHELQELERAVLRKDRSLDLRAGVEAAEETTAAPRQLPGAVADFVGREAQIADMVGFLTGDGVRYAVPVVVVSGRAGVGKTALAVRVAHEVGRVFGDGHVYLDLRGDDPPAALAARVLRALGVAAVPTDRGTSSDGFRARWSLGHARSATDRCLPIHATPTCDTFSIFA